MAAAVAGISLPGQDGADTSYPEILGSHTMGEALLSATFTYQEKSWTFGSMRSRTRSLLDYLQCKNIDQGLRTLPKILEISRDIKTKLLVIKVTTNSADLSQQIVRFLTAHLDEFLVNRTQTRGGMKARFALQRLKDARVNESVARKEFMKFAADNRGYATSLDPAVRVEGISLENELKLRQQLVATLAVAYEQALMDEKNDTPILNVLDPGNLPVLKSGPSRGRMVLTSFFLVSVLAWTLQNHKWLLRKWDGLDGKA